MQKIYPCLWFDANGVEAMNFYVSTFKDSRVINTIPGPDGGVLAGNFEIQGHRYMFINGGPMFKLSEAISILVECEDQAEVDRLWDKFTADGGAPTACGWLKDKFGLSWQIVPKILLQGLSDPDPAARTRVTQAMMTMQKIDIAAIERAYSGTA